MATQTGLVLTPDLLEAHPWVQTAIVEFDAGPRPAGNAATTWLQELAAASHPATVTRLVLVNHELAGYFALSSAQVELSTAHRRWIGVLHPTVGATLVAWLAKDRRELIDGGILVEAAFGIARQAARLQGGIALVLDPYDAETSEMWMRPPYSFKRSRTTSPRTGLPRLWTPLFPVG